MEAAHLKYAILHHGIFVISTPTLFSILVLLEFTPPASISLSDTLVSMVVSCNNTIVIIIIGQVTAVQKVVVDQWMATKKIIAQYVLQLKQAL